MWRIYEQVDTSEYLEPSYSGLRLFISRLTLQSNNTQLLLDQPSKSAY